MESQAIAARGHIIVRRPHIILASLCVVLVTAIFYQLAAPLPPVELARVAPGSAPQERPLPVWTAPSRETFAVIDERVLLDSQRRSFSAGPAALDAGSPSPLGAALVGVIIESQARIAIFKLGTSETSVPVGGSINGWQITQVDPDRIVIRSGGIDRAILLDANRSAPTISPGPQVSAPQNPPANFFAAQKAIEKEVDECRHAVLTTNGAAEITPAQCEELVAKNHTPPKDSPSDK